ncbi:HotDog domain-containing protein [Lipomyces tetrasporus]|uniref:HotDog domain-containing protein n=1 Tax=Lipomyces tetrasporus TaxID=54092 RepID=A0AAD7QXE6_9ASCO|nr:HotDog domain-containing protein [Lipomyces tetrasporus]KAJ8103125.1 HotDog domain-containing protein [Lipomyces tetrasporus]
MKSALPFVQRVWSSFLMTSGLEPTLIPRLKLVDAVPGHVKLELTIEKSHTNRLEILHGGTVASLADLAGSLAVSSRGMFSTGVSTDLNVTYISSGGKIGDKIFIESKCHKLGRSLAFTTVEFYKSQKYELFARGTHTKYVAAAMKDENNRLEEYNA